MREVLSASHAAKNGAIGVAITSVNHQVGTKSESRSNVVLMPGRLRGCRGDSIDRHAGKETSRFHRRICVVQELAVDGQLGAEDVINLDHVLAEIENISQRRYFPEGIARSSGIGRRELGEEVFDVRRRDRIERGRGDAGSVSCAGTCSSAAVCPLSADYVVELSICHPRIGYGGGRIGVGDNAARLFGNKEKSLVPLLINLRNPNRAAHSAAKIVVAKQWPLHA